MKKLAYIFSMVFFLGHTAFASGETVIKESENGNAIEVVLVEEGNISLFTHEKEVLPATIPQDPLDPFTKVYTTYYVSKGDNELVEVNCSNYRKVLKEQMADKPEVADKIGSKGYRLPDIQEIVEAYNGK